MSPSPYQLLLPDLNEAASSPSSDGAFFPNIPIVGNLSIEEQKMCNPLRRKVALMLKSLDYNPDETDVRPVVSAFIENVDPELSPFFWVL